MRVAENREFALCKRLRGEMSTSCLPSLESYIDCIVNDPTMMSKQWDGQALANCRRREEAEDIRRWWMNRL